MPAAGNLFSFGVAEI